ncbi:hypothetical protein RJ639_036580, partial [Escallonia herrerae]
MRIFMSNTHEKTQLTSWKSPSDPSVGIYSVGNNPPNLPQLKAWNGSNPYWRSGLWNGQKFIGIPKKDSSYSNGFDLIKQDDGSTYLTFDVGNESIITYFFLDSGGTLLQKYWDDGKEDWEIPWTAVGDEYDVYGKCRAFGSCNVQDSRLCTCLEGFEPRNFDERSRKNWTIPDFAEWSDAPEGVCGSKCLNNCSCIAYTYNIGIGCMLWSGNLIDIVKFRESDDGVDLYVRLAYSELDKKKNMDLIIAVTVITGSVSLVLVTIIAWKCMAKGKDDQMIFAESAKKNRSRLLLYRRGKSSLEKMNRVKLEDLPVFKFEKLAEGTENFHAAQKLGQGGFGAVYK